MKKRILMTVAGVAVVTVSAAAYYRTTQAKDAPQFTTAVVTRGDVIENVAATGTLEAVTTVQVGSQASGVVKALYADFNSQVRKGQVIAELDPALFQTQVDQAQATLVRLQAEVNRAQVELQDAQTKLTRARQLKDQGLISSADFDAADTTTRSADAALKSAEANVVQARASLNQNRVNLDHAIITAPIDGVVVSRNVDVGQTVAASMSAPTLFVIANDLRHMRVNARIDESDIGQIRAGQPVTFHVDAYPDQAFAGTVTEVRLQPIVEQNVVSYVTMIDVPNPELKLKPGMTANVSVEIAKAEDTLRVPAAALRFRPDEPGEPNKVRPTGSGEPDPSTGSGSSRATSRGDKARPTGRGPRVFTLVDGQLHPIPVHVGVNDGAMAAVDGEGLAEGTTIVTGSAVAAKTATAPPAAGSPLLPRFGNRGAGRGRG